MKQYEDFACLLIEQADEFDMLSAHLKTAYDYYIEAIAALFIFFCYSETLGDGDSLSIFTVCLLLDFVDLSFYLCFSFYL